MVFRGLIRPGVAVLLGSCAIAQGASPQVPSGTYSGRVRCTGSDRFSNSSPIRKYDSSPAVSVVFGPGQRLRRWTYLFLGRHNLAVQSHAVRAGQSFTYAAGAHIGRPGRTRVTIAAVSHAGASLEIVARLDWASPATDYIGSGTYALTLSRVGGSQIRYEAVKVVIKQPLGGPSRANPVVRRNEHCVGLLGR